MNYAINNLTAPDTYTQASTLGPMMGVSRFLLDVYNTGIYWQICQINTQARPGGSQAGEWGSEVFMGVGSRAITRMGLVAIRFRAAVPAASLPAGQTQAQVTVEGVIS